MNEVYAYLRTLSPAPKIIKTKRNIIDDYCTERKMTITQTYVDKGLILDGAMPENLQKLLTAHGQHYTLVVLNTNQLWKNDTTHALISHQLRGLHVELISIEQPSYSLYDDPLPHFSAADLDEVLTQHERLSTSLRLKRERVPKLIPEERIRVSPPLGYKCSDGKIRVDPETAPIVQDIFVRYLQCGSITKLQRHLVGRGITHLNGWHFTKEALRGILSNDYYAGCVTIGGKRIEGLHEPIVDVDTFDTVESLLRSNRRSYYN